MRPCELCVYIRFSFVLLIIFGLIGLVKKLQIIAFLGSFYALYIGLKSSFKLYAIKTAIKTNEIFGISGCSMEPKFPFDLPLFKLGFFKPSALCGSDAPSVPMDVSLNAFQEYFINLYANGWFLLPKYQLLDMAQCCIIIFSMIIYGLFVLVFLYVRRVLSESN